MNYYPFHVGDYAAHTAHLEPMEDLAYRRMLDLYYLRECALPQEPAEVARLIRMRSNVAEVEAVLREFFTSNDGDGWIHTRCEAELSRMQDKQAKAKASAQASVNARIAKQTSERTATVERTLNERSADVELPTPTPTPIKDFPPASRVPPADAGRPRASRRCPESFAPDQILTQWARHEAPQADFDRELAKFRDHTFKTAHSDWPAAFRNWLRRASDDAAKRPQSFQDRKAAEAAKWMNPPSKAGFDFIDMEASNAAPLAIR